MAGCVRRAISPPPFRKSCFWRRAFTPPHSISLRDLGHDEILCATIVSEQAGVSPCQKTYGLMQKWPIFAVK